MTGGADPFRAIHADGWAEPIDVPSLNHEVSDLLLDHIEQVRRAGMDEGAALRSSSVLLLGPAGSGKTHLFARLRKQAGARAAFILSRPEIGVDPSPRQVLASIVDSLRRPVAGEDHKQIDVIVGALLASLEGGRERYPFLFLDDARRMSGEAQRDLRERAVARAEDRFPEISARYLERLLSLPFAGRQDQRALFAWLSGREPSPIELDRLGEGSGLADLDLMPALRTLGVAAAFGAPIVLVFDQLENLVEPGQSTSRIVAHARLLSELRDTVRGLVIVQMALDAEWMTRIHPVLHESDRARLEESVKTLRLPTPAERRALLERWREALPEAERAAPFPYPFSSAEVEGWTRARGMTPRMLMQACGEAYARARSGPDGARAGEPGVVDEPAGAQGPGERLQMQWEQAISRARVEIDEAVQQARGVAGERLQSGLVAAMRLLGHEPGEAASKHAPSFQLRGRLGEREVLVVQHAHPRSLAAAIRAATTLAVERPVILLRERALAIPPTWKEVTGLLSALALTPGAIFLRVDRDDLARLLALTDFLAAARSQDLSDAEGRPIAHAEVWRWAEESLRCAGWAPLVSIVNGADEPPALPARGASPSPPPPIVEPRASVPPLSAKGAAPRVGSGVRTILERLRVVSLDRLVREARSLDPQATRTSVSVELQRIPVRIFGGAIVALEDR
jgi:hypothetical protein